MILRIAYEKTKEHESEMAACAEMVKTEKCWHTDVLNSYATLDQFYKGYFSCAIGKEFARATRTINDGPPLSILDIGAGRGETSLYLANHGHRVTPVEPSYEFCEVIDHIGRRFGKDLTIYNSSAEHLDIPGEQFDVIVFNVSLHHCDDPALSLINAYRLLRPGGQLLLVNEPMLPFFKSHARMQRELAAAPDEFGHYGGNEHSYHCAEYRAMIRQAGFRNLQSELVARYLSKEVIAQAMQADHRPRGIRRTVKKLYLHLVHSLEAARLEPILFVMKQLSLVQLTFSADKPDQPTRQQRMRSTHPGI
jgi:ubiquinone/menaquinone biosynthesis C-methylase UbiE